MGVQTDLALSHAGSKPSQNNVAAWLESALESFMQDLIAWLALPEVGLLAIFLFSLLAATLLPISSEAVLLGYLAAVPNMLWVAIGVATLGNTLGGMISYGMGAGVHGVFGRWRARKRATDADPPSALTASPAPATAPALTPARVRAELWVNKFGPPILLLTWLPVVGDPLCAVAGWLRLSFWPSVFYMAAGKLGRYLAVAWALRWAISPT